MEKRLCIITGANSGIGKAAAFQISQKGYHTILACRDSEKGKRALQEIERNFQGASAELMIVDMSRQSSIQEFSQKFLQKYERLDVLIHNAAIFDITQKEINFTSERIEAVWATNHLGPALLTQFFLDAIKKSEQGRIITIASKGLKAKPFLKIDLKDPEFRKKKFSIVDAYYQSKRAQVMYTLWLAGELKNTAITANCIQVPAVQVDISKYSNLPSIMKSLYSFKSKFSLTPEEMAKTYTYLATSDEVSSLTGKCFDEKMRVVKSNKYSCQAENIQDVMNLTRSYFQQFDSASS
jgi:NAD(P)-dependent dehydrogenase (short-subunit alcohol dehydrogenase family)